MSIIYEKIAVSGKDKSKMVNALIDSGATDVFINENIAKEIGAILLPLSQLKIPMANNDKVKADRMMIKLNVKGCIIQAEALSVKDLKDDVIIGTNFFQHNNVEIEFSEKKDSFKIKNCNANLLKSTGPRL